MVSDTSLPSCGSQTPALEPPSGTFSLILPRQETQSCSFHFSSLIYTIRFVRTHILPIRPCRMNHLNLHVINPYQPLGHALGEVHGTVLPSRVAEGDLKVVAAGVQFCQCGNAASSNVANCHCLLRQSTLVREGCDGDDHIKRLPNGRPCPGRHGESTLHQQVSESKL